MGRGALGVLVSLHRHLNCSDYMFSFISLYFPLFTLHLKRCIVNDCKDRSQWEHDDTMSFPSVNGADSCTVVRFS